MQLQIGQGRQSIPVLWALAALEFSNAVIWVALMVSQYWLQGTAWLGPSQPAFLGIIAAYPILLLTPLLIKYVVKGSSLLPLYAVNLLQMAALTWGVLR